MAHKRNNPFFEAVLDFASRDNEPITREIQGSLTRRDFPVVFFHDSNGIPVILDKGGEHFGFQESFTGFQNGKPVENGEDAVHFERLVAIKSFRESVYRGRDAASYLYNLGLITSERQKELLDESEKAG